MAKTRVIPLAVNMGILLLNNPNRNHSIVPKAKREYINSDMPPVSFVRMVFMAWGRKDTVVKAAAANPKIVMVFMI